MPGGSGTTIIGWDSNSEVGNIVLGNVGTGGSCEATNAMAAIANGTPNTAWFKAPTADTDLIFCVWNASGGGLLVQSATILAASILTTSGVWNQLSLVTTAALSTSGSYYMGFQKHGNYQQFRQSNAVNSYWSTEVAGTWPNPNNPFTPAGSRNPHQLAIYFSVESSAGVPIAWTV